MNIVLCGFMGCGKSTVGKILARRLGMSFADTDSLVEARLGKPVSKIFAEDGEAVFRDAEHEVCAELCRGDGKVIATGGGALTFERNAELFRGKCTVVFIDVPLRIIRSRVACDGSRPLWDGNTQELFDRRRPKYIAASEFTVDGSGGSDEVAEEVINLIGKEKLK